MMHGLYKLLLIQVLACLGQNVLGSEIIHGKRAREKSMPYMASLQDRYGQHICGGFLLSKDVVVTAAHCDVEKIEMVVLGTHNLNQVEKTVKYITKICKNQSNDSVNGIILLKLGGADNQQNRAQPIHLPTSEMNIQDNETCHVAGWGSTAKGGKAVSDLMVVNVSILNKQVCQNQLHGRLANVICTGGYGTKKGLCKGDSGGPLVCNGKAVGVALFKGGKCNYPGTPNIYADISKFRPWIDNVLKKKAC